MYILLIILFSINVFAAHKSEEFVIHSEMDYLMQIVRTTAEAFPDRRHSSSFIDLYDAFSKEKSWEGYKGQEKNMALSMIHYLIPELPSEVHIHPDASSTHQHIIHLCPWGTKPIASFLARNACFKYKVTFSPQELLLRQDCQSPAVSHGNRILLFWKCESDTMLQKALEQAKIAFDVAVIHPSWPDFDKYKPFVKISRSYASSVKECFDFFTYVRERHQDFYSAELTEFMGYLAASYDASNDRIQCTFFSSAQVFQDHLLTTLDYISPTQESYAVDASIKRLLNKVEICYAWNKCPEDKMKVFIEKGRPYYNLMRDCASLTHCKSVAMQFLLYTKRIVLQEMGKVHILTEYNDAFIEYQKKLKDFFTQTPLSHPKNAVVSESAKAPEVRTMTCYQSIECAYKFLLAMKKKAQKKYSFMFNNLLICLDSSYAALMRQEVSLQGIFQNPELLRSVIFEVLDYIVPDYSFSSRMQEKETVGWTLFYQDENSSPEQSLDVSSGHECYPMMTLFQNLKGGARVALAYMIFMTQEPDLKVKVHQRPAVQKSNLLKTYEKTVIEFLYGNQNSQGFLVSCQGAEEAEYVSAFQVNIPSYQGIQGYNLMAVRAILSDNLVLDVPKNAQTSLSFVAEWLANFFGARKSDRMWDAALNMNAAEAFDAMVRGYRSDSKHTFTTVINLSPNISPPVFATLPEVLWSMIGAIIYLAPDYHKDKAQLLMNDDGTVQCTLTHKLKVQYYFPAQSLPKGLQTFIKDIKTLKKRDSVILKMLELAGYLPSTALYQIPHTQSSDGSRSFTEMLASLNLLHGSAAV